MGRYLVTGVAGFIGARTAALLLEAGHTVTGCDNLQPYYDVALKEYRLRKLRESHPEAFTFESLDIEEAPALEALVAAGKFDGCLHLAARAGVRHSLREPHAYIATNVDGTVNVLEALRKAGVPKLVFASTSSLYAGNPSPFVETMRTERALSPYAASKKSAEVLAHAYHHLYGIDTSIVRYFTVYGEAGRPDMSPLRFSRWVLEGRPIRLFGSGEQRRDFTYVGDIAAGNVAALQPVGFEVFNLGGGSEPVSMNAFIALIEAAAGKCATIEREPMDKSEMDVTQADIGKARAMLGWEPQVGLEEGVRRTVEWVRAEGSGYSLEVG